MTGLYGGIRLVVSKNWQLQSYLRERTQLVDSALDRYLLREETIPAVIQESMRYSIFVEGKRIRPILMLAACEAIGGEINDILPVA